MEREIIPFSEIFALMMKNVYPPDFKCWFNVLCYRFIILFRMEI